MELARLLGSVVFLLISNSLRLTDCQNIDTRQPILREINGLADVYNIIGACIIMKNTKNLTLILLDESSLIISIRIFARLHNV